MKEIFLVAVFLFSSFIYPQKNTQGKVEYTISYNKTNKKEMPIPVNNERVINAINNTRDVKAYLYFTQEESLYRIEAPLGNDTEKGINLTRIFAGKDEAFYYNITTKMFLLEKSNMGDLFLISKKPIEWDITQETKRIGSYNCFKAIKKDTVDLKKKTIAWFTPQIPVSFGPNKYNGLPGLILELEVSSFNYKVTKIELNPKEPVVIKKPNKGIKISEEEYSKLLKEYFPEFFKKVKK